VGNLILRYSPTFEEGSLVRNGHRMTGEELRALKDKLQQLNVDLERFKEELLTSRVEELQRIIHAPVRRSCPLANEITVLTDQDAN